MAFPLTGIENANEFYSQHYLDEIVDNDLKPLFNRWKEQGANSPVSSVRTAGGAAYFRARERFVSERKTADRLPLLIDLAQPLLQAIGYEQTEGRELPEPMLVSAVRHSALAGDCEENSAFQSG